MRSVTLGAEIHVELVILPVVPYLTVESVKPVDIAGHAGVVCRPTKAASHCVESVPEVAERSLPETPSEVETPTVRSRPS